MVALGSFSLLQIGLLLWSSCSLGGGVSAPLQDGWRAELRQHCLGSLEAPDQGAIVSRNSTDNVFRGLIETLETRRLMSGEQGLTGTYFQNMDLTGPSVTR